MSFDVFQITKITQGCCIINYYLQYFVLQSDQTSEIFIHSFSVIIPCIIAPHLIQCSWLFPHTCATKGYSRLGRVARQLRRVSSSDGRRASLTDNCLFYTWSKSFIILFIYYIYTYHINYKHFHLIILKNENVASIINRISGTWNFWTC